MATEKRLLTDRAIQIIAENKIVAAIEAGDFDQLPGFGRPCAIFDEPYDPQWWVRRKLKREELGSLTTCVAERSSNRVENVAWSAACQRDSR